MKELLSDIEKYFIISLSKFQENDFILLLFDI